MQKCTELGRGLMLIMNIYQHFKFTSELTGETDPKNEQSEKEKVPVISAVLDIHGLLGVLFLSCWRFSEGFLRLQIL